MAIQAPPVNMIANPYVPDYGRIQANALNIKNARQQNQLNAKKLATYDTDRAAAAQEAELTKSMKIWKTALDAYSKGGKSAFDSTFKQFGEDVPNVEFDGKEKITVRLPDGTEITGTPKQFKDHADFFSENKVGEGPPLTGQVILQGAQEIGMEIKAPKPSEKETKPEYTPGKAAEKIASLEKQKAQVLATGAIDPTGLAILQAVSPEMAAEAMKNKGDTKKVIKAIDRAIAYIQQFEPRTAEDPLGLR